MRTYIVKRHGSSNTANILGICGLVEASSRKVALKRAEAEFTCYNGQFLEVVAAGRCSRDDCNEAAQMQMWCDEENAQWANWAN